MINGFFLRVIQSFKNFYIFILIIVHFIILDTDDQVRLLKQIIKDENIDDKRWPAKQLLNLIDKWKNKGLYPEDISSNDGDYFANAKGHLLYKIYQERLKYFNAVDFGDLILESIRLFENNQDILESYQNLSLIHI